MLEDDEEVAIGGVEGFVAHVLAGGKYENAQAGFHSWVTGAAEMFEGVYPVFCLIHIEWIPPELVGNLVKWRLGGSLNCTIVCGEVAV